MVRRREARVRTVLPVRVFGMDSSGKPFTTLAHTLDITNSGARLAGLQHSLTVGDVVGVQRGTDKARFRVAWAGTADSRNAGQAGLECVQTRKNIWNIIFDESPPDTFDVSSLDNPPVTPSKPPERRRHPRRACDIGLEMQVEGSDVSIFARCTDISHGGCYVESRSPLPTGTRLYICLKTESLRVRALTDVRSSHPSMGMGLKFVQLGEDDERNLLQLLEDLGIREPLAAESTLTPILEANLESLRRLSDEFRRSDLSLNTVRMVGSAIDVLIRTLDCTLRHLQESARMPQLRPALVAEQLRAATGLLNELAPALSADALDAGLRRDLRSAAEELLERLHSGNTVPGFDTPFIVPSTRPV